MLIAVNDSISSKFLSSPEELEVVAVSLDLQLSTILYLVHVPPDAPFIILALCVST